MSFLANFPFWNTTELCLNLRVSVLEEFFQLLVFTLLLKTPSPTWVYKQPVHPFCPLSFMLPPQPQPLLSTSITKHNFWMHISWGKLMCVWLCLYVCMFGWGSWGWRWGERGVVTHSGKSQTKSPKVPCHTWITLGTHCIRLSELYLHGQDKSSFLGHGPEELPKHRKLKANSCHFHCGQYHSIFILFPSL